MRAAQRGFSYRRFSDKEGHAGIFAFGEIRRDAHVIDAVDELFLFDAHDVHRHRAGEEANARFLGAGELLLKGGDVLFAHDPPHHRAAHAEAVRLPGPASARELRELLHLQCGRAGADV